MVNISTIDKFCHNYFLVFIYTLAIEPKYVQKGWRHAYARSSLIKVADKESQVLSKRVPDHQRVVREDGKIQLILQEFFNDIR